MIKPILNIGNMCYKCPWFKADVEMNKHYDGVKYADTDIHIFCKHKNLCDHIKSFLKDELTPEEPNTCEPNELNKEPNNELDEPKRSYFDTKVYERKSIILKNME